MPSQTEAGKAFEFALLIQSFILLSKKQNVTIIKDSSFSIAEKSFKQFNELEQYKYSKAANSSINHIVELEPRLQNQISDDDILTLQIIPDSEGTIGDVRDVIFIRSSQNWEIGISAKNNHRAIKHSRLSDQIDFGSKWLGLNCSENYFNTIKPIFSELRLLKANKEIWKNQHNKQSRFYLPVLNAFKDELHRLDGESNNKVPEYLLKYLIGSKDFYKVIKRSAKTEIYGFHLYGTLNKTFGQIKPVFKVHKLNLPSRIIDISFKKNSNATLILTCDEGWQISFRIHNASTLVEPSLKFDINLIGQPQNLYSHHLKW